MSNYKTLNLAYPENSQIDFMINRFPDGQQSVTLIVDPAHLTPVREDGVIIKSRLNTFRDLELIVCATAALRNTGIQNIQLYTPYFMGARSDRRFMEGDANYLKQVICPIINSQKFESVTVLDPHSDVLEACLDNFVKINNHDIVKKALTDIDNKNNAQDRIVLVSPDAGAQKKIFNVAQKFGIQKVITANKVRNVRTGEIVNTDVPSLTGNFCMDPGQKFVIVDDICDGGRTFIELAKAIRLQRPDAEIYLIVTHGIFSNSFYELSKHIKKVYSSNSYSDIDSEQHSDHTVGKDYLMQFNSF
jgi:ribose-phosphate pyrophosphokinase